MSEWIDIKSWDAMPPKKRPAQCAFLFKKEISERDGTVRLGAIVQLQRYFGHRECIAFFPVPDLPE